MCLCFVCLREVVCGGCVAVGSGFQIASKGDCRLWVGEASVGNGLLTAALSACAMCCG